jgi:hypothetical protein
MIPTDIYPRDADALWFVVDHRRVVHRLTENKNQSLRRCRRRPPWLRDGYLPAQGHLQLTRDLNLP